MAGTPAHGQYLRSLESRQERRSAVRLLQWCRMGELGKYLGNLEWNHAAGRGSDAADGDDGASGRPVPYQCRVGAVLPNDFLRHFRQQVAVAESNPVDHRQSERI